MATLFALFQWYGGVIPGRNLLMNNSFNAIYIWWGVTDTCVESYCPEEYDPLRVCQCNDICEEFGTCCEDVIECPGKIIVILTHYFTSINKF